MENKNTIIGAALIALGIIIGLASMNFIDGSIIFYALAIGFIAGYFVKGRCLGLLIPGCILSALALFITMDELILDFSGLYFLIMLGAAFLSVFMIHTVRYNSGNWGEKYWPLFPGFSLMLIGGMVLAVEGNLISFNLEYLNLITPAILIIIGAVMLVSNFKKSTRNS
ncbi:MAG: hypothetical protein ACOZCL_10900 [Bacillota bacterium]